MKLIRRDNKVRKSAVEIILTKLQEKVSDIVILAIFAALYILIQIPLGYMMNLRHHTNPYKEDYVLPDSLYKVFPEVNITTLNTVVKTISYTILGVSLIAFAIHVDRIIIFIKLLFCLVLLNMIKIAILAGTDVPDPSPKCDCFPELTFKLTFGGAISALFRVDGCNNLFSGFISTCIVLTLFWSYYFNQFIGISLWFLSFVNAVLVVFSRRSYTIDAVITTIITVLVFEQVQHWYPQRHKTMD